MFASELMELARKNPQKYGGKRYKVVKGAANSRDGIDINEILVDREGDLIANGSVRVYVANFTELEEIQQPVSFMEAVKAYSDGKTVKCKYQVEHTYTHKMGSIGMCDENRNAVDAIEILHGVWHICD